HTINDDRQSSNIVSKVATTKAAATVSNEERGKQNLLCEFKMLVFDGLVVGGVNWRLSINL
ncbi:hypothetical protein DOY81_001714, partial [Sarcophaga bullata]